MKEFQKKIHKNNLMVGWWDEKPKNRDIELNAVRINFMHSILSNQLEDVRRGKRIDIEFIHQRIDEVMKMDLDDFEIFLLSNSLDAF